MYCLQWMIPVLLIPKHWLHPIFLIEQALFMWIYTISFFLVKKPCYICSAIFVIALGLICYSDTDACIFWPTCTARNDGQVCSYIYKNEYENKGR